ncbi:MAG TPA: transposase family protein [Gemmataceae bacterium]|nr:transposase family protein [Gemmataceae bacterium]
MPIRTFADWKEPLPGYLEIDFVAHCGSLMQGTFLWSFVATDVCSGWTEVVPLVAREQSLVTEGLEVMRLQFPMPILGIDSDNDSAFINETLLAYCQQQKLEFTRSRAYQKNDQAWIEQKNGPVVRRFVGYERFSGMVAGQCLARLFQAVRLYVNHFQPSFKLKAKTREGAKVKKAYHKPITPCVRLLTHASVAETVKEKLRWERDRLDPLELLQRIRDSQAALAALGSGDLDNGPQRQSLEQFLGKLSGRRFEDVDRLREETEAWSSDVNASQRGVDWQMKIDDARTKLKSVYPTIKP